MDDYRDLDEYNRRLESAHYRRTLEKHRVDAPFVLPKPFKPTTSKMKYISPKGVVKGCLADLKSRLRNG